MAAIPKEVTSLVDLIYRAYEKKNEGKDYLSRIGASGIGAECVRSIWYDWRGAASEKIPGRIYRLFQTGHIQEERVVQDLKDAGLKVWELDPETGKQWEYKFARGHSVCKADGIVVGVPTAEKTPHVLEIKSSNLNGFKEIQKHGVKKAKPDHYAQMHMGMMGAGMSDALYVVICKDDEQYYVERVKLDIEEVNAINKKLHQLVEQTIIPIRVAEKEGDWRCKYCDAKGVCWGKEEPRKTCRMCTHSVIMDDTIWGCMIHKKELTLDEQLKGCDTWSKL
jgi:hypothetical protein